MNESIKKVYHFNGKVKSDIYKVNGKIVRKINYNSDGILVDDKVICEVTKRIVK